MVPMCQERMQMLSQNAQNREGYIKKENPKFPQEYKRNKFKSKLTKLFTGNGK